MIASFSIGKNTGKSNQYPVYGSSGFPKNCRALIIANIDGYQSGAYTPEEALDSIDRNCGRYGYTWHEK